MKISEHYDAREFVSEATWNKWGERSVWFINPLQVLFGEWLTSQFGHKAIVNNWHFFKENPHPKGDEEWYMDGHIYSHSGYREPECTEGAKESQHRAHNGNDWKIPGYDPEFIRDEIRRNFIALKARFGLTTIEKDCHTWVHSDNRWTNMEELFEVPFQ